MIPAGCKTRQGRNDGVSRSCAGNLDKMGHLLCCERTGLEFSQTVYFVIFLPEQPWHATRKKKPAKKEPN
jgi:hypothetical protein